MFGLHKTDEVKRSEKVQKLIALMSRREGAFNYDLNRVMFRYGAIIFNLRSEGYQITTTPVKKGLFHYKITGKV